MKRFIIGVTVMVLSGCRSIAPMATPPALSATSGAPIIITADRYQTMAFTTWYDSTWKAVSSASFDDTHVYFISPDEDALILIAPTDHNTADIRPPAMSVDQTIRQESLALSDQFSIYLIASDELMNTYQAIFHQMADSVQIIE
jgi:hypothetical protein